MGSCLTKFPGTFCCYHYSNVCNLKTFHPGNENNNCFRSVFKPEPWLYTQFITECSKEHIHEVVSVCELVVKNAVVNDARDVGSRAALANLKEDLLQFIKFVEYVTYVKKELEYGERCSRDEFTGITRGIGSYTRRACWERSSETTTSPNDSYREGKEGKEIGSETTEPGRNRGVLTNTKLEEIEEY
jgi:hypothetical protein